MVFATCGDDNHNAENSCGSFVMANCDSLTYDNIISALLKGNFYVSHGPNINELYVENGSVTINCSDAKRISFTTHGRRSKAFNAEKGKLINEAVFELTDADVYFRVSVTDEYGNRADSQNYYIKDLTGDKKDE